MKDTTDARVEFVELVNRPAAVNVPQNAVVQHEVVGHVERRTIACVIISTVGVVKTRKSAAGRNVVDLIEINKAAAGRVTVHDRSLLETSLYKLSIVPVLTTELNNRDKIHKHMHTDT